MEPNVHSTGLLPRDEEQAQLAPLKPLAALRWLSSMCFVPTTAQYKYGLRPLTQRATARGIPTAQSTLRTTSSQRQTPLLRSLSVPALQDSIIRAKKHAICSSPGQIANWYEPLGQGPLITNSHICWRVSRPWRTTSAVRLSTEQTMKAMSNFC